MRIGICLNIAEIRYPKTTVGNSLIQARGTGLIGKADLPDYSLSPWHKYKNEYMMARRPSKISISSSAVAFSSVSLPVSGWCCRPINMRKTAMDITQAHKIIEETAGTIAELFPILHDVTSEDIEKALNSSEDYDDE